MYIYAEGRQLRKFLQYSHKFISLVAPSDDQGFLIYKSKFEGLVCGPIKSSTNQFKYQTKSFS